MQGLLTALSKHRPICCARVTRVTRMAYSPSLWLMANWLVKQNQPVSKIETKSDTNLRSLYESCQIVVLFFTPRMRLKEHICLFCNWLPNSLPSLRYTVQCYWWLTDCNKLSRLSRSPSDDRSKSPTWIERKQSSPKRGNERGPR